MPFPLVWYSFWLFIFLCFIKSFADVFKFTKCIFNRRSQIGSGTDYNQLDEFQQVEQVEKFEFGGELVWKNQSRNMQNYIEQR